MYAYTQIERTTSGTNLYMHTIYCIKHKYEKKWCFIVHIKVVSHQQLKERLLGL